MDNCRQEVKKSSDDLWHRFNDIILKNLNPQFPGAIKSISPIWEKVSTKLDRNLWETKESIRRAINKEFNG